MPLLCIFLSRLTHQVEGVLIKKYNQKYSAVLLLYFNDSFFLKGR